MTEQRHLVLIGLMGAGKTTVGERCAQRLARPFVDTDEVVETATGLSVAELFARSGESVFREHERQAVADACASPEPLVISCGGGAVLDGDSRRALRGCGCVVWLDATPATLARRVERQHVERPLLAGSAAPVSLDRLARTRAPAYEATAHVRIDTEGRTVDQVVELVLKELAQCAA